MNPDEHIARAERNIRSAKLLLADEDYMGSVSRTYYAMFEAAHAALLWGNASLNPATTKTHRGLIAAVGQYLVKPGLLAAEYGRSLNRVERLRLVGDYSGEKVDAEQAAWAIAEAESFLQAVRQEFEPRKENEDENGGAP